MPELDPWFLANALLASRDYLRNPASGAIHKTIYMPEVESFELCVPQTVTEQRRIVAALNQQIVVLRLAQAKAFAIDEDTKLLSAGLRESALLIGAETKLDEVAHIAGQLVDPTLSQYRILPHINGENIEQATGRLGSYKSAAEDKVFSQRFKFEKGDVLYSKLRPYLRKATLAPEEGLCSADIYPLKVFKDKILPEFLLLELLSDRFTRYAIKESARSRMPKLNRDALFKWKLFVPSLGEQQSIVDTIRESAAAIESLRHRARAQTAELDLMEPALLRAAFSGAL